MRYFILFCYLFLPRIAIAIEVPPTPNEPGIGTIATNLMGPVNVVSSFISSAAIVVGVTMLFGAFLRYMQYRVNPLANPISTVIVLAILGLALLCIPLLSKYAGYPIQLF